MSTFAAIMKSSLTLSELLLVLLTPLVFYPLYLFLAKKFGLSDKPGGRSSHIRQTITGAGLVFTLSLLVIYFFTDTFLPVNFIIGLSFIVLVSFIDDIVFIRHSYRFVAQFLVMILLISTIPVSVEGDFYDKLPVWVAGCVFGVCVLNGFNFMDGINGMLSLSCMVILLSLAYLNETLVTAEGLPLQFIDPLVIYSLIVSVGGFLFLNLRAKALAFMGDAGSIGIAFSIVYIVFLLVSKTGNISYLLLFSVLGIDSGLTVVYKLILRENIFIPHRDFLFKKLVHIGKFGHVRVAVIYALIQALVNITVILFPFNKSIYSQISVVFIALTLQIVAFILVRNRFTKTRIIRIFSERKERH